MPDSLVSMEGLVPDVYTRLRVYKRPDSSGTSAAHTRRPIPSRSSTARRLNLRRREEKTRSRSFSSTRSVCVALVFHSAMLVPRCCATFANTPHRSLLCSDIAFCFALFRNVLFAVGTRRLIHNAHQQFCSRATVFALLICFWLAIAHSCIAVLACARDIRSGWPNCRPTSP